MQFAAMVEGRLIRRYKRFFAEVELDGGAIVTAHCANPGSMRSCAPEGARVWLSAARPGLKLAWTWELVEVAGALICVNTGRANGVVAEGLAGGVVAEVAAYQTIRREVAYGERSRVDFLLERHSGGAVEQCYLEVKNVTLDGGDGMAAFPDSVTERGTRHLEELMEMVAHGHRAVLLFCCSRSDARRVRPADEIDPRYGATLRRAAAAGVEVLAYGCEVSPAGVWLRHRLPAEL
jgi:sugar fermentation stimulation protein A